MIASSAETEALIDRLLDGDEDAWMTFVESWGPFMATVARKTLRRYDASSSEQDVEDAVASAWENLLEKNGALLRTCRDMGNLPQTLHTLTRNRSVDLLRKRRKLRRIDDTGALEDPHTDGTPIVDDDTEAIPAAELRSALDSLDGRSSTFVWLFYWQGKSYREIAHLTGASINSIGPTLSRALGKLRDLLSRATA